jgi:hypothetical protein
MLSRASIARFLASFGEGGANPQPPPGRLAAILPFLLEV